jgi:hypothetical protein
MLDVRVSVSAIDTFDYFLNDENGDYQDYQALLAQLRGEMPRNEAMIAGSALHKALELARPGETSALEADGYRFNFRSDIELELPQTRELKAEQKYDLGDIIITLVGKVDCIEGRTITDHKTMSRFDIDRLWEGYQWRFYLQMFKANRFRWNVFVLNWDSGQTCAGFDGKAVTEYEIKEFHQLEQWRYPEMEQECLSKLRQFAEFLGLADMKPPVRPYAGERVWLADLLKGNR